MKAATARDPNRIFLEQGQLIDAALRKGVRDALLRHKALGNPVVIERNGRIVWVRPEELLNE